MMLAIYIFGGFIVITVLATWLYRMVEKRERRRNWETFASQQGFRYDPGKGTRYPSMSGRYRERNLNVYVFVPRVGSAGPITQFEAEFRFRLPGGLSIVAESMGARFKKAMGGKDIEIGIKEVDDALRVTCPDEQAARTILGNEPARRAIVQFVTSRARSEITSTGVSFVFEDFEFEHVRLKMGMDVVVDAADAIEAALAA